MKQPNLTQPTPRIVTRGQPDETLCHGLILRWWPDNDPSALTVPWWTLLLITACRYLAPHVSIAATVPDRDFAGGFL